MTKTYIVLNKVLTILLYFDQINAALMSIRDKHLTNPKV